MKQYDCKHSNPHVFAVGSVVLKKDFTRKKHAGGNLDRKWLGPYKISCALACLSSKTSEIHAKIVLSAAVLGVNPLTALNRVAKFSIFVSAVLCLPNINQSEADVITVYIQYVH